MEERNLWIYLKLYSKAQCRQEIGRQSSHFVSFSFALSQYTGGREGKKREKRTFFPRWAANVGITNRRPAARQRPAVLKQTASGLPLLPPSLYSLNLSSSLLFSHSFLFSRASRTGGVRIYAREMGNRDWPAVNAPFVPN